MWTRSIVTRGSAVSETVVRRYVRRSRDTAEFLELIGNSESAPFETMRDALVYAAMVGLNGERREAVQPSGDPISDDTLRGNAQFEVVLHLIQVISFAATEGANCVSHEQDDRMYRDFEQYANGGLHILREAFEESRLAVEVFFLQRFNRELLSDS